MRRDGSGSRDAHGAAGGGWAGSGAARGRAEVDLGAGPPASRQQRWV